MDARRISSSILAGGELYCLLRSGLTSHGPGLVSMQVPFLGQAGSFGIAHAAVNEY